MATKASGTLFLIIEKQHVSLDLVMVTAWTKSKLCVRLYRMSKCRSVMF